MKTFKIFNDFYFKNKYLFLNVTTGAFILNRRIKNIT